MGRIALEGLRFYAYHGYHKEENVLGGNYQVDVYLEGDIEQSGEDDLLQHTIDYKKIYDIVESKMQTRSNLLEHVAKTILDEIMDSSYTINHARVRVSKLNPPLHGPVARVYVELEERQN